MNAQPKPRDDEAPPPPQRFTLPYAPRGLRRVEAAAYIGVSPSTFDWMIGEGLMPKPKRIGGRVVWDRMQVEECFAAIPNDDDGPKPSFWDQVE